jgi:hypothetical protein
VPTQLDRDELHRLVQMGATVRLAEIKRERAMLAGIINGQPSSPRQPAALSSEPVKGRRRKRRAAVATAVATDGRRRGRRRGKLSAAGRAAISAAQKKRWAAIKKMKGRSES